MGDIRSCVLARLNEIELDGTNPLLSQGYVYQMVLQHEYQHNETMLQTLQLKQGAPYTPLQRFACPAGRAEISRDMVRFPGGALDIGTDDRSAAYDNERPHHWIELAPFWIDRAPVTNGDFADFIEAGGYATRSYWSEAGWNWVKTSVARSPMYWTRSADGWHSRSMDHSARIEPDHPVCHVSYYEAEAFARYAGKRLPTEFEWEAAASWNPSGSKVSFPWGEQLPTKDLANLDQLSFGTTAIGSYPSNVSPLGCYGMIGDVWEWTSSDFLGYPGFQSFPYPEYSEAFFGSEYKVLRGGSWATRPGAIRSTFRNWDYPIRRQIFSGFRCARDD